MLSVGLSERGIEMKKLDLTEWAAISEILGTTAVIASLIFVAYTVDRNTVVMQAANDNVQYQIQDERARDIATNPELASITLKLRRNEELSDVEKERIFMQQVRELNMWELAYRRHAQGLYSPVQWRAWNDYYEFEFTAEFPEEWWTRVKPWYPDDFEKHVDAAYASK